jgi:hypothetical protein
MRSCWPDLPSLRVLRLSVRVCAQACAAINLIRCVGSPVDEIVLHTGEIGQVERKLSGADFRALCSQITEAPENQGFTELSGVGIGESRAEVAPGMKKGAIVRPSIRCPVYTPASIPCSVKTAVWMFWC